MDLTAKDVADLLHVSEATLRRWVTESKIPYYRMKQEIRFSRTELENWLLLRQEKGSYPSKGVEEVGMHHFALYRAIHKGGVFHDVPGRTKEEVIGSAMVQIAKELSLDADILTSLLLEREKLMPTSLSKGVGVPHTRDFLLQESFDVVAVVFPKEPIEYGALDGEKVHTLFFLFACDDKRHLHLLSKLAYLTSDKEALSYLKERPKKGDLLPYIKEWEGSLNRLKPITV